MIKLSSLLVIGLLSVSAQAGKVEHITLSPTSGVVAVEGPIMEGSAAGVSNAILSVHLQGAKEVWIFINSPGGSVVAGGRIIAQIENLKRKGVTVNTVCTGLCASMAAHIHQYGDKRYMTEYSILMFHPASGGAEGELDKMHSQLNFFKAYVERFDRNVAKRGKITIEKYKQLQQNEAWLDENQAADMNFSDGTVSTDVPVVEKRSLFDALFGGLFKDFQIKK